MTSGYLTAAQISQKRWQLLSSPSPASGEPSSPSPDSGESSSPALSDPSSPPPASGRAGRVGTPKSSSTKDTTCIRSVVVGRQRRRRKARHPSPPLTVTSPSPPPPPRGPKSPPRSTAPPSSPASPRRAAVSRPVHPAPTTYSPSANPVQATRHSPAASWPRPVPSHLTAPPLLHPSWTQPAPSWPPPPPPPPVDTNHGRVQDNHLDTCDDWSFVWRVSAAHWRLIITGYGSVFLVAFILAKYPVTRQWSCDVLVCLLGLLFQAIHWLRTPAVEETGLRFPFQHCNFPPAPVPYGPICTCPAGVMDWTKYYPTAVAGLDPVIRDIESMRNTSLPPLQPHLTNALQSFSFLRLQQHHYSGLHRILFDGANAAANQLNHTMTGWCEILWPCSLLRPQRLFDKVERALHDFCKNEQETLSSPAFATQSATNDAVEKATFELEWAQIWANLYNVSPSNYDFAVWNRSAAYFSFRPLSLPNRTCPLGADLLKSFRELRSSRASRYQLKTWVVDVVLLLEWLFRMRNVELDVRSITTPV